VTNFPYGKLLFIHSKITGKSLISDKHFFHQGTACLLRL